ncbi:hypothetical protein Anas_13219 [Armadillidium nasatum]|uniref:Uncharacterized protein n=1 Tax=Armadillidium nasatum TaxID=96803 RepID=A0A5N5TEE8_9CRUS|nr:hypothetical protein Anas_13219 [Armadillidium nasatum]
MQLREKIENISIHIAKELRPREEIQQLHAITSTLENLDIVSSKWQSSQYRSQKHLKIFFSQISKLRKK